MSPISSKFLHWRGHMPPISLPKFLLFLWRQLGRLLEGHRLWRFRFQRLRTRLQQHSKERWFGPDGFLKIHNQFHLSLRYGGQICVSCHVASDRPFVPSPKNLSRAWAAQAAEVLTSSKIAPTENCQVASLGSFDNEDALAWSKVINSSFQGVCFEHSDDFPSGLLGTNSTALQ